MTTDTGHSSWNPALRPNTAQDAQQHTPVATKPSPVATYDSQHVSTIASPHGIANGHGLPAEQPQADEDPLDLSIGSLPHGAPTEQREEGQNGSDMQSISHGFTSDSARHASDTTDDESRSTNKHLSTMSFARTISADISWAEDDEVDFDLSQRDDVAQPLIKSIASTNSFPIVPPAHKTSAERGLTLPHSQAEDILLEVEHQVHEIDEDGFVTSELSPPSASTEEGSTADPSARNVETWDLQPLGIKTGDGPDTDFGLPAQYDDDVPLMDAQEQDEARAEMHYQVAAPTLDNQAGLEREEDNSWMEDGLNSFEHSTASPNARSNGPSAATHSNDASMHSMLDSETIHEYKTPTRTMDFDINDDGDAEDDFFTSIGKATEQVEFTADHINGHDEPSWMHDEEAASSHPVSLQNTFEVSFADESVATTSTPSGTLPEHTHARSGSTHRLDIAQAFNDGDLAAQWEAALAEDDFLADEELLASDHELGSAVDQSAFLGSDDEGFLDENAQSQAQASTIAVATAVAAKPNNPLSRYAPTNPSIRVDPGASAPANHTTIGDLPFRAGAPAVPYPFTQSQQPAFAAAASQQRPEIPKTQSFADRNKGGYTSPYDLPMDVIKPRKRPTAVPLSRTATSPSAPPPRTSSANSSLSRPSTAGLMSPGASTLPPISPLAPMPPKPKLAQTAFFEDLPVSARPKVAPRTVTTAPSMEHMRMNGQDAPPPMHQISAPPKPIGPGPPREKGPIADSSSTNSSPLRRTVTSPPTASIYELVAPGMVSPYAALPIDHIAPPPTSRYSPAPVTSGPPSDQSQRYASMPAQAFSQTPSSVENLSPMQQGFTGPNAAALHHPRTSSPLAQFGSGPAHQHGQAGLPPRSMPPLPMHTAKSDHQAQEQNDFTTMRTMDQQRSQPIQHMQYAQHAHRMPSLQRNSARTPPQPQNAKTTYSPSKRVASNYAPHNQPHVNTFIPPTRSQTQSPRSAMAGARRELVPASPYPRPASVELPSSPRFTPVNPTLVEYQAPPVRPIGQPRPQEPMQSFALPTDGREHDPLARWKGCPLIAWGLGGNIVTTFPKDSPRYGIGSSLPTIVRKQGEITVRNVKDIFQTDNLTLSFPGPLKGKAKKKELLAWLFAGIKEQQDACMYLNAMERLSHDERRMQERLLLWQTLRVFVEHDGQLEASPAVEKAVRQALSSKSEVDGPDDSLHTALSRSSNPNMGTATARTEAVDPAAIERIKSNLLQGEREKAVWEAVDKRLWAHAMLIANTVSKDLYKQVAQEFIQKEVRYAGNNTESLAALYEVFAGNLEESVDELVPPSARAGFQLVNPGQDVGPSKDALDGLDQWLETLLLILSNRSSDDTQALLSLGKLLAGYGRVEAAHICFIFARTSSRFSGLDDPLANIVLVGADQIRQPYDFDRHLESLLLSEVYEYGLSLATSSTYIPHLAGYKFQHALILAESGQREKALQYCDSLASFITSQTRRSPYHHQHLTAALDDLNKRLKQSPKDGSGSWISKPSIDKVSGSVWATFNKFVAGDDAEATATPNSIPEIGPFARIAGDTPNISRQASQADISSLGTHLPSSTARSSSRYGPNGSYTPPAYEPPATSSSGSQGRASMESRPSLEMRRPFESQRKMSDYRPGSKGGADVYTPTSTYNPYSEDSPRSLNRGRSPPVKQPYIENLHAASNAVSSYTPYDHPLSSPQDYLNHGQAHTSGTLESTVMHSNSAGDAPTWTPAHDVSNGTTNGYDSAQTNGYDPVEYSGYEPPTNDSYQPYQPDPESPEDKPKRKIYMDDDDDDAGTVPQVRKDSAPREKTRAEKDREAEDAFRKAAEEDAKKGATTQAPKKGWLGGWFGGKKEATGETSQPGKPIRAKLGEASSFYYDPDQKRWVNKKAGAETAPAATPTPPPPRAVTTGPPKPSSSTPPPPNMPRAVSTTSMPPLAPRDSSIGSTRSEEVPDPAKLGATLDRSRSVATLGTGPPSRPASSMSKADDIYDDLLGPPGAARGKGTIKKAKKGRGYIDVMGNKGSGG